MKKKITSIVLSGAMLLSGSAFAYNDISDHWAKAYIANMKNAGVLEQFDDDSIYPEWKMTREECAVLISDFAETYYNYKLPYIKGNYKFPDLIDGENADKIRALSMLTYNSVMTSEIDVVPTKIIKGYPTIDFDNPFKPNHTVTRAEFAKMLMNAIDCFGYMSVGNYAQIASDADLHWGRHHLMLAHGYGIMNGYRSEEGNFIMLSEYENEVYSTPVGMYVELRPNGNITRAEAIKMVASARGLRYVGLEYSEGATRPEGEYNLYYLSE